MKDAKKNCNSVPSNPTSDANMEKTAELCKALGHPVRLRILKFLINKGVCISGELSEILPLAPSTISEHLRILKASGLVQGNIDGPRRNYCVDLKALLAFQTKIQEL